MIKDDYKYECQSLKDVRKRYTGKEGLALYKIGQVNEAESKLKESYDPRLKGMDVSEHLSTYAIIQSRKIRTNLNAKSMLHKALLDSGFNAF